MFVVPKYDGPYTVFATGGNIVIFATKAKLLQHCGGYRKLCGGLCETRPSNLTAWQEADLEDSYFTPAIRYVILNSLGDALTMEDFGAFAPDAASSHLGSFWRRFPGSKRAAYRNWLRYPRTQNERRLNALVVREDDEPAWRAARSLRSLPTSWDDIYRSTERSWKRHRRTQYHR